MERGPWETPPLTAVMRGGPSVGRRARRVVEEWVHHQIQTSSSARMTKAAAMAISQASSGSGGGLRTDIWGGKSGISVGLGGAGISSDLGARGGEFPAPTGLAAFSIRTASAIT